MQRRRTARPEPTDEHRILDFGGFPGRWEILRSTEETRGELLEMRFTIESTTGDSPPVHIHPDATERYHVRSGVLEVQIDGEWREIPAGESYSVPPGTPHTFRNREPVQLIDIHEPAHDIERFFRRFHRLVIEWGVSLPPGDFKSAVLLGMLFSDHEREVVSVNPPRWAMKGLAALGRLLGYHLPD